MNNDMKKVQPFDSFSAVCRILVWAGYYEPLNKPTTRLKRKLNQMYRLLVLLFSIVYNLQHLIFTVQNRHDMDKLLDCLVIEIPQLNMLAKVLNMLVQNHRIQKIQEVLTGHIFEAKDELDEEILKRNVLEMSRLYKCLNFGIIMSGFLWPSSFFVKRFTDKNEVVNSYVPFKTDTWAAFALSVFLETGPILWTGFGHLGIDQLIAAYYAQAHTQLKIIEHQLQSFCTINEDNPISNSLEYIDSTDENIRKRFKQIVKRYDTLVWYKNEVATAFNFPLAVQFLSTASVVCLVIFRMTALSVTSFPFMFLALLFFLLLIQVFLYCYYGNLVEFESRLINDALYESDWLSLSPSFRRLLLIAMCRWSRPIRPRVCGIVPLSLTTFVQIIRSSYSLYAVLVITAEPTTNP